MTQTQFNLDALENLMVMTVSGCTTHGLVLAESGSARGRTVARAWCPVCGEEPASA